MYKKLNIAGELGVVEIMVLSRITVSIPSSKKLLSGVSRSAAQAAILLQQNYHHLIDHSLVASMSFASN